MHFYLVNQFILNNFLTIGQRRLIVPYSESACKTASDRMSPHLYFDDWKTFIFTSFVSDSAVKVIFLAIFYAKFYRRNVWQQSEWFFSNIYWVYIRRQQLSKH